VGASAALAGQWQAGRTARKEKRREEQLDLLARLWDAADRHWRASIEAAYAVQEVIDARRDGELTDEHNERRMEALSERVSAYHEVRRLLAQMRLLRSPAYPAAQALSARRYDMNDEEKSEAERDAA
jgi:hypothetical protein